MTFSDLARRNVRGNIRRYLAFFLSCVLSVAVFYIFMSFVTNPTVLTGQIVRPDAVTGQLIAGGRDGVNRGLEACSAIIVIFSFCFTTYSNGAFIRARKKEFGLLELLGMTRRQLRRMVLDESLIIAGAALVLGLAAGIALSKLFLMAMAAMLYVNSPIGFSVTPTGVLITAGVFAGIFLLAALFSAARIRRDSIHELIAAQRRPPKLPPRLRPVALVIGLALLAAAYTWAWGTSGRDLVRNFLPIVALTIAGTYLVIFQGSVLAGRLLARNRPLYQRGTNLVVINRLVFRLTDNARILFTIAILVAVVTSAFGTLNTIFTGARTRAQAASPYAVFFDIPSASVSAAEMGAVNARTLQIIKDHGMTDIQAQTFDEYRGTLGLGKGPSTGAADGAALGVLAVSNSAYNAATGIVTGLKPVNLAPGEALLVSPSGAVISGTDQKSDQWPLSATFETTTQQTVQVTITGSVARSWPQAPRALVMNDADFAHLAGLTGGQGKIVAFGYEFRGWQRASGLRAAVQASLPTQDGSGVVSRFEAYGRLRQEAALTMFIGIFVCAVFFLAAGSLIYFKLFTEIGEDRRHYQILRDIGITRGEVGQLIGRELGALFFVPLVIGAVHTVFALKTLSNALVGFNATTAGITVLAVYLAAQAVYYAATRAAYAREVLRGG